MTTTGFTRRTSENSIFFPRRVPRLYRAQISSAFMNGARALSVITTSRRVNPRRRFPVMLPMCTIP